MFVVGCGGATSTLLGENSDVVARIEGSAVAGVDMVISPDEGSPTDGQACTTSSNGFGCMSTTTSTSKQFTFTTDSNASDSPYYLYLENNTVAPITVHLTVTMNGTMDIDQDITVPVGGVDLYAKIFRNNAELVP